MQKLLVRRLVGYGPTVLFVTMFVFALTLLVPYDPAAILLGDQMDPELLKAFRHDLGLDRPIPVQYADWMWGVVRGDWGRSIRTGERITTELKNRYIVTLELALGSILVTLLIAIPVGIYSAVRPHSVGDNVGTVFAIAGVALPHFWLGVLLIYAFAVILGWLPASGYVEPWDDPLENLRLFILPVLMSGTGSVAAIMRQARSALLEVLRQDYIRTAHSKGLSERVVLLRHAVKNSLIPVVTVMGLHTAVLLEGSVITETIFGLPGMGQFAVNAARTLDFVAIQGSLLVFGTIIILANFIVDITYGFLDPRVRYT